MRKYKGIENISIENSIYYTPTSDTRMKNQNHIQELNICGVFDTIKIKWSYHVITFFRCSNIYYASDDLVAKNHTSNYEKMTIATIFKFFTEFKNSYQALKFANRYKNAFEDKFSLSIKRDENINEILGKKNNFLVKFFKPFKTFIEYVI